MAPPKVPKMGKAVLQLTLAGLREAGFQEYAIGRPSHSRRGACERQPGRHQLDKTKPRSKGKRKKKNNRGKSAPAWEQPQL